MFIAIFQTIAPTGLVGVGYTSSRQTRPSGSRRSILVLTLHCARLTLAQ